MTDTATEGTPGTPPPDTGTPPAEPPPSQPPPEGEPVDHEADAKKWRELARKHEDRAKANATAAKELEKLKTSLMDDQEKAVAEAKALGAAEAAKTYGGRLVAAEIRAAAAGRLATEQLDVLVDGVNVTAFLTDDGDVDRDKVTAFVDGIAPQATDTAAAPFPDLGQGARGQQMALNGDPLEAALKAKLGIR